MLVRTREALRTDGMVEEGETTLDESALRGEFQPRPLGPGHREMAGQVRGPRQGRLKLGRLKLGRL